MISDRNFLSQQRFGIHSLGGSRPASSIIKESSDSSRVDGRQSWIPSTETIEGALATAQTLGQRLGPRGPVTFVTGGHEPLCGMLRMHSAQAKTIGLTSQVFTNVGLAMKWLEVH